MKLMLVRGNPRKNGFTQYLTDLFVSGAREVGAEVRDVDLPDLKIEPCLGCYYCWLTRPGQCIHHDPMQQLLPLVVESQVLVCATPVYYFAMSSYLKTFFERTFPLTTEGLELIEIAPGIDLERDVLAHMGFKPILRDVKTMDPGLFQEQWGGLAAALAAKAAAHPA